MKVVFAVPPECSLGKSLKARIVTENKYRNFIQIGCRNGDMLVRSGEGAMLLQNGGEFSGTGHLFFRRRSRQRYIRRNGAARTIRPYILPQASLCLTRTSPPAYRPTAHHKRPTPDKDTARPPRR